MSYWRNLRHSIYPGVTDLNNAESKEVKLSQDPPIKFTVIGLMITSEFQKCKYIVENLHRCYPKQFSKPKVEGLLNLKWNEFVRYEQRSRGGFFWRLQKCVAIYCNDEFLGDDTALSKYVSSRFIIPMKRFHVMGREALRQYLMDVMSDGKRCVYLMVGIDGIVVGSMLFLLYEDMVPKTCELFLRRCRKRKGGYSGTPIHRIVESSWIQCGGYRLKEAKIPCENYVVSHNSRGVLSMCNSGRHKKNSTQFLITLDKSDWMDSNYVAFGQIIHGDWVLSQIEKVPTKYQEPQQNVRIIQAGEFQLCAAKMSDGKHGPALEEFLDDRISKEADDYKNYSAEAEVDVDGKSEDGGEMLMEHLESDMRSYYPLKMLPDRILDSFNLVAGKKSSCMFEIENCWKCGCSHDVGQCLKVTSDVFSTNS